MTIRLFEPTTPNNIPPFPNCDRRRSRLFTALYAKPYDPEESRTMCFNFGNPLVYQPEGSDDIITEWPDGRIEREHGPLNPGRTRRQG